MKISILGTGMVARTMASRLVDLGHVVILGTRDRESKISPDNNQMANENFRKWYSEQEGISLMNFVDIPSATELFINATNGQASLQALKMVGADKLAGKVLLDIANPLDFSNGMPPTLSVCNFDSLGEQIQRTFPACRVVKSLNTMNANLMVNPQSLSGDHSVFVSGDHLESKEKVKNLLMEMGWKEINILDLGDISTSRGSEMLLPLWLRLWGALQTPVFNFNIVRE